MNKITSTLVGLALAAGVSVAPAFAQGNLFSPPGGFTFFFSGANNSSFFATSQSVGFNPTGTTTNSTAAFSLTGTRIDSSPVYTLTSLVYTPANGSTFVETSPMLFTVVGLPSGATSVASVGAAPDGTTFNLVSAAPAVPEASTVVSFGALLALGGLAVVTAKRKSVKNAA